VLVVPYAVVRPTTGTATLSRIYWDEIVRSTAGLVRVRRRRNGAELRLTGAGPALLRFGGPRVVAGTEAVVVTYTIEGGMLACRPGARWYWPSLGRAGASRVGAAVKVVYDTEPPRHRGRN
jgi:hypothetical protein